MSLCFPSVYELYVCIIICTSACSGVRSSVGFSSLAQQVCGAHPTSPSDISRTKGLEPCNFTGGQRIQASFIPAIQRRHTKCLYLYEDPYYTSDLEKGSEIVRTDHVPGIAPNKPKESDVDNKPLLLFDPLASTTICLFVIPSRIANGSLNGPEDRQTIINNRVLKRHSDMLSIILRSDPLQSFLVTFSSAKHLIGGGRLCIGDMRVGKSQIC